MEKMFERAKNVKASQGRYPKLGIGQHKLATSVAKLVDGANGQFAILEAVVLESDQTDHVGQTRAWLVKLNGKYPDSAMGSVKALCAALMGLSPDDSRVDTMVTPSVMESIFSEKNPLKGVCVYANGVKSAKSDYVNHYFSPCIDASGMPLKFLEAATPTPTPTPSVGTLGFPGVPPAPPSVPSATAPFPPAPWRAHPTAEGWYWDGGNAVKSGEDLRALLNI